MVAVAPRAAATVVLLRERGTGLETFMMRRAMTMAFAPGMHVFPGGRLDPADLQTGSHLTAYPFADDAPRASTDEAGMRALVACALREVHEETSVRLRDADLTLIDHWVTPAIATRRFDVRFFAAPVPSGQEPVASGTEMDEVGWIAPRDALDAFDAGQIKLLRPTTRVLEYLTDFATVEDLLASARTRSIRPLLPERTVHPDGSDSWAIIDDRTGAVLEADVPPPRFWEGMEP